jgi:hypothetical protein
MKPSRRTLLKSLLALPALWAAKAFGLPADKPMSETWKAYAGKRWWKLNEVTKQVEQIPGHYSGKLQLAKDAGIDPNIWYPADGGIRTRPGYLDVCSVDSMKPWCMYHLDNNKIACGYKDFQVVKSGSRTIISFETPDLT